jgi:Flp pilus assembly protein TadG
LKESFAERLPRLRALLSVLRLNERGTALVEFALIGPILFLLVFGVLDFSLALNNYNQLSQLAGQGARAAAVNRCPDGTALGSCTIQNQLNNTYAKGKMQGNTTVTVCFPPGSSSGVGNPITVRASYQFHFIPVFQSIPGLGGSAGITISASQTERQEIAYTGTTGPTCP